ncbi:universal stress protein [Streptomyces sp. NPDC006208]|uniref:universal stress protein n=1 Tax=Streptomyces sp. NPDC006208 TaxID=3156734 RepID=UPI0033AB45DD
MRRTITAGIDGSLESLAAAEWAAREALLRDLPLALVQAGPRPLPRTHPSGIDAPAGQEDHLDSAVRELLVGFPELHVVPMCRPGPAGDALLAAAGESEMLVLGSRGFSGLAGFVIGSVALDVTARARVPVVLVRGGWTADEASLPAQARPVLLGLDLDGLDLESAGDELISFAFDMAAARGVPLEVLHSWRLPQLYPYGRAYDPLPAPDAAVLAAERQQALTSALRPWRDKHAEVPLRVRLVAGRAAHQLLKAATRASLLVVGHRDGAGTRLGPVTQAAVHHVACPVAIVPHDHVPEAATVGAAER